VPDQPADAITVTGPRYLRLATTLLQRMRLASAAGGIWEAADVQWWSRQERATDRDGQLFWLDERGEPWAAVLRTDFGRSLQCDALVLPTDPGHERAIWRAAVGRADATGGPAEFPVRLDNATGTAELAAAGYRPAAGESVITSWLEAARRPAIPPLAAGYRLLSRADAPPGPHPMAARNGLQLAARLRGCSLYRPELDLMVAAPDGRAAGYGLFWADPVTRVGLVEPMRTEEAHQRRGIASHILATGLDRLAALGCQRLKVSNDIPLYLRAGFQPLPAATAAVYARPA
jgi:GNAT superfamily N-acetyltransferase